MSAIDKGRRGARTGARRARIATVVVLALVTAIAPAAVSAAPFLNFGTVSVGSIKILGTTVPLEGALSDLPPETVLYAGGDPTIDLALQLSGISIPVTAGSLYATVGEVTATYHLSWFHNADSDYSIQDDGCATGTGSCTVDVTFAPTQAGERTDTVRWNIFDLQITGGGTLGSLVQLMASLIGGTFADQLTIELTGIGVPSSDSVNAQVDIAASAACIELSTSAIDFGSSTLGAEDLAAQPTITVTNCSGVGETLFARGTDASGPSSAWSLVDSAATCATDLGLDNYRLGLGLQDLSVVGLSTLNKTIQSLAAGEAADQVARIWTACPGSTGAGVVMTMQIHYLVVGD